MPKEHVVTFVESHIMVGYDRIMREGEALKSKSEAFLGESARLKSIERECSKMKHQIARKKVYAAGGGNEGRMDMIVNDLKKMRELLKDHYPRAEFKAEETKESDRDYRLEESVHLLGWDVNLDGNMTRENKGMIDVIKGLCDRQQELDKRIGDLQLMGNKYAISVRSSAQLSDDSTEKFKGACGFSIASPILFAISITGFLFQLYPAIHQFWVNLMIVLGSASAAISGAVLTSKDNYGDFVKNREIKDFGFSWEDIRFGGEKANEDEKTGLARCWQRFRRCICCCCCCTSRKGFTRQSFLALIFGYSAIFLCILGFAIYIYSQVDREGACLVLQVSSGAYGFFLTAVLFRFGTYLRYRQFHLANEVAKKFKPESVKSV